MALAQTSSREMRGEMRAVAREVLAVRDAIGPLDLLSFEFQFRLRFARERESEKSFEPSFVCDVVVHIRVPS